MSDVKRFTRGPVALRNNYEDSFGTGHCLLSKDGHGIYICHLYVDVKGKSQQTTDKWQSERRANMELIKEVFDISTEAGLTPCQLLAERGALRVVCQELAGALTELLDNHVQLVSCGDCGSWDVETEAAVIQARSALAKHAGLRAYPNAGSPVPEYNPDDRVSNAGVLEHMKKQEERG